jgi:hypothetical protein
MANTLQAGASSFDITPEDSQFLFGYPHVERYSTGIHDPLLSSALYLSDGTVQLMFIANDIIFISKAMSLRVRRKIRQSTGIPIENIIISATHTHSGPMTVKCISNANDIAVPEVDKKYIRFLEDRLVAVAIDAYENKTEAVAGLSIADSSGIGTNRHDPAGPADHQVPVLVLKSSKSDDYIACMLVCTMHPTVLHEDSTLISADFPGMARQYMQNAGMDCPVLHHTGPSGNLSPRHVTKANTFAEAKRIGNILGKSVIKAVSGIDFIPNITLKAHRTEVNLHRKNFPTVGTARKLLETAHARLEHLRIEGADSSEIRTAECDWFGAEETLSLAQSAAEGRLEDVYQSCLPAEIQVCAIGPWTFIGWPGELFVEYALAVKRNYRDTFIISLANGELQGYIVTQEAAAENTYEASNALFSHHSGMVILNETVNLLKMGK